MTIPTKVLGLLALTLACGLFSAGCRSMSQPASASFASVTISAKSVGQISNTAVAVFREDGYQTVGSSEELVFEKEGTRANTLAYDGMVAAQAGAQTIVRVRAEMVDLGGGSHRLQCQAFMVSSAGSFFADEHRLANFRRGPFQKLLNEVARRLKQP